MTTNLSSLAKHAMAVAGASGRMGQMLIEAILDATDLQLVGALDQAHSNNLASDAAAFLGKKSGVNITHSLAEALKNARCLIDFTRPEGTLNHLQYCVENNVQMVIGTTGFTAEQKIQITQAAQKIAIVLAPNMSVAVNVMIKLLSVAATSLNEGFDIEIIEAHHRHKVDAPSGTALQMGHTIANALGHELSELALYAREGVIGERPKNIIGFSTIRAGDIIGDHTALFAGLGERIEITHKSSSRAIYAQGALRAARFLSQRETGLYDMQDVLNLR